MRRVVIIPTYNERENISQLIPAILQLKISNLHILVVDDSSPDGTSAEVERWSKDSPYVHLLRRAEKKGLGRAYVAGFKWALDNNFEQIIEMDADFSHRPEDLKKIVESSAGYDFVIGSRYVAGGGTSNWTAFRKFLSRGGSFYARTILNYPIRDWTGGFNAWNDYVLKDIGVEKITSDGYSFQIELKYKALKKGYRYLETPILFEERREGQSKMSKDIVFEALSQVWKMR